MNPYHDQKLLVDYHLNRANQLLANQIPSPSTIEIDLTDGACNQACQHCFFGSSPSNLLQKIDSDLLLNFLSSAYAHGTSAFELVGGGEPTAHPKVADIVQRIALLSHPSNDIPPVIGLVTNGVLLNRIFPVIDCIEWIRISLDSVDEATYNTMHGVQPQHKHLSKVLANIRESVRVSSRDKIRIGYLVVPPFNHQPKQIRALVKIAMDMGVKHVAFRPVSLTHYGNLSEWKLASEAILEEKARCPKGFILGGTGGSWGYVLGEHQQPTGICRSRPLVMVIKADGTIPTCILYRQQVDVRKPLGNIAQGFEPVWFSDFHMQSWQSVDRQTCPNVCKHFRADMAMIQASEISNKVRIDPSVVDDPYFI